MSLPNVLLVIDHLGVGGVQEYYLNIIRAGRGEARFTVVSLFGADVYSDRMRDAGADVIFCSRRDYSVGTVLRFSGFVQYRRFLRDHADRFDRIHVRLFAGFLYSYLLGLFRRKTASAGLDARRKQLPWYVQGVFIAVARTCHEFYLPRDYWREYRLLRIRPERLRDTIYLVTRRRMDQPVHLCHDFNILTIGRVIRQKGFMEAIQLLEHMCKLTSRDIGLHIIGDGPDRSRLEEYVTHRGLTNVHFLGTITEIDGYFASAGMVLKLAHGEGINSVVRESLLAQIMLASTLETDECHDFAKNNLVIPIERNDLQGSAQQIVDFIEGRKTIDLELASRRIQSEAERDRIVHDLVRAA